MGGLTGLATMADTAITSTYWRKVVYYRPIAYWPLWETAGTSARCLVNSAQNGTYNSDVSGWPPGTGIGDGNTAPYFSGDDYVNIFSATLAAALNGAAHSVMAWVKVSAAGDWTDGSRREAVRYIEGIGSNEYGWLAKDSNNNQWWFRSVASAVVEDVRAASGAPLTWVHMVMTRDETADQVKAYISGAQFGATQTVLGAWGASVITAARIGSSNAGTAFWKGWIQHVAFFNGALTLPQIADLATV